MNSGSSEEKSVTTGAFIAEDDPSLNNNQLARARLYRMSVRHCQICIFAFLLLMYLFWA